MVVVVVVVVVDGYRPFLMHKAGKKKKMEHKEHRACVCRGLNTAVRRQKESLSPSLPFHPRPLLPLQHCSILSAYSLTFFSFAHHSTRQSEDHLSDRLNAFLPSPLPYNRPVVIPRDSSQQQSFTVSSPSSINNTNHQDSRNCHSPQLTISHPVHLPLFNTTYSSSHLS
jgi:hypothetical protein